MDFGRKMPFFPLDCGKMSAENMIFMCRNKNRSAESEKRISADWMWKFVKTIFSRVVGKEKLARNGLFVSIWAFRMCKHGLTKCRTGCFMAYSPTGFLPEEEGDVCRFVAFSAKSCLLGYGMSREIRVFVFAARWTPEYGNREWTRWTKWQKVSSPFPFLEACRKSSGFSFVVFK